MPLKLQAYLSLGLSSLMLRLLLWTELRLFHPLTNLRGNRILWHCFWVFSYQFHWTSLVKASLNDEHTILTKKIVSYWDQSSKCILLLWNYTYILSFVFTANNSSRVTQAIFSVALLCIQCISLQVLVKQIECAE